jgi:hypothetical protein
MTEIGRVFEKRSGRDGRRAFPRRTREADGDRAADHVVLFPDPEPVNRRTPAGGRAGRTPL